MPGGVTTEVKLIRCSSTTNRTASHSARNLPCLRSLDRRSHRPGPRCRSEDVNRAVAAAKTAFEEEGPWASTTTQERGRVLFRLAEKLRANLPALAELECRNTGKPIIEPNTTSLTPPPASKILRQYGDKSRRLRQSRPRQRHVAHAEKNQSASPDDHSLNYPLLMAG